MRLVTILFFISLLVYCHISAQTDFSPDKEFIQQQLNASGEDYGPLLSYLILDDIIYAGTEYGIYLSTDMGNEWVHVLKIPEIQLIKFLNDKLYACSGSGLYQSKNGGRSWEGVYFDDMVDSVWLVDDVLHFRSPHNGIYQSIGEFQFRQISTFPEELELPVDYFKPCKEYDIEFTFSGKGSGTQEDPYQIETIKQFQELREDYFGDHYYILMNDIDATETRYWNPRHSDSGDTVNYLGFLNINGNYIRSIDGRGHKISYLYTYLDNYGGFHLFLGNNCFTMKRIGFENLLFEGNGIVNMLQIHPTDSKDFVLEECYFTGTIKLNDVKDATTLYPLGEFYNNSVINNCYTDFTIITDLTISNFGSIGSRTTDTAQIKNCYALGNNNSSWTLSPFGYNGNVISCFWDADKIKVTDDSLGLGLGLTTADMMKRTTFESAGWDFENVWYIEEGMDYPKLKCFRDGVGVEDKVPVKTGIAEMLITANSDKIKIEYTLPSPGQVRIKIFNSLGALEGIIFEGFSQISDSGSTQFDASALPSGMYFITLESAGIRLCRQYALIK